jgi:hypothetical protein
MSSTMRGRFSTPQDQADYHPYGTGATHMTMPLARVIITGEGMTYETLQPIFTADGAAVPATAAGSWGQLHAAGRP